MALTPAEYQAVQYAIDATLKAHIQEPFALLREAGIVADLRSRLYGCANFATPVTAQLLDSINSHPLRIVRTSRVQLEITVRDRRFRTRRSGEHKTIDIGILSNAPSLYLARNGPGDVLQQLPPLSLDAAIEVKASPSSDLAERGKYIKDLLVLLYLQTAHGCSGQFVLADKCLALYGPGPLPPNGMLNWMMAGPQPMAIEVGGPRIRVDACFLDFGICLTKKKPNGAAVDVYLLSLTPAGTWAPQRLYAQLTPQVSVLANAAANAAANAPTKAAMAAAKKSAKRRASAGTEVANAAPEAAAPIAAGLGDFIESVFQDVIKRCR